MIRFILLTLVLAPTTLLAQTAERQVIGSSGGFSTTSALKVSHTIGQTVTTTGTSSNIILTQGFEQPGKHIVGVDEMKQRLLVNIYPSMASDKVTIEMQTTAVINIAVYDQQGRHTGLVIENIESDGNTRRELDVSSLKPGHYFISFLHDNTPLGTAKMLKVN